MSVEIQHSEEIQDDIQLRCIYADSRPALEQAYAEGASREARVRTIAPALLNDPAFLTEVADENLSASHIWRIEDNLYAAAQALFDDIVETHQGPTNAEDAALIGARTIAANLQGYLFPAAMLRERDYSAQTMVVTPFHEHEDQRFWFHAGVLNLLREADAVTTVEVPAAKLPAINAPQPPDPSLLYRLRHLRQEAYIYKLGIGFWER
ncbi:MAG: hypothetical protein VXZ99_19170, partial [Pseudomonadota bacterium]|nr:hypothetical protein [Pseudomonadota bacterium]